MNLFFKRNTRLIICGVFLSFMFCASEVCAQQTGKFVYEGREINLPPGAMFRPKHFKYIDYSEKLQAVGKHAVTKDFMADFSEEDMHNFKTKYQEDYAYYQEALAYFAKLSDRVNKAYTTKELWYIYIYDQELKNKLLHF